MTPTLGSLFQLGNARHGDAHAIDRGRGRDEQALEIVIAQQKLAVLRHLDDAETRGIGAKTWMPPGPQE